MKYRIDNGSYRLLPLDVRSVCRTVVPKCQNLGSVVVALARLVVNGSSDVLIITMSRFCFNSCLIVYSGTYSIS